MVTVLTMTMIAGITTIVVLFVIRFREFSAPVVLPLPESITLPDDSTAVAFTQGRNWYAVVTEDNEILIFDREDGETDAYDQGRRVICGLELEGRGG